MKDKTLIKTYSYFFNDSEEFVKEHLENYKEMIYILKNIYSNIKDMKKEYNIHLGETKIGIENKKTKESYFITIEF